MSGNELYKFDGISAPTLVRDLLSGAASSAPARRMYEQNGALYFAANTSNAGRSGDLPPRAPGVTIRPRRTYLRKVF